MLLFSSLLVEILAGLHGRRASLRYGIDNVLRARSGAGDKDSWSRGQGRSSQHRRCHKAVACTRNRR